MTINHEGISGELAVPTLNEVMAGLDRRPAIAHWARHRQLWPTRRHSTVPTQLADHESAMVGLGRPLLRYLDSPLSVLTVAFKHHRHIACAMQHALNTNRTIGNSKENHVASQGCQSQPRRQVVAADIAHRGLADALALLQELGNETPGIGPAVFCDVVADVEKVLPALRRESDFGHYAGRFPRALAADFLADLATDSA